LPTFFIALFAAAVARAIASGFLALAFVAGLRFADFAAVAARDFSFLPATFLAATFFRADFTGADLALAFAAGFFASTSALGFFDFFAIWHPFVFGVVAILLIPQELAKKFRDFDRGIR
jgi:hypothetical protein